MPEFTIMTGVRGTIGLLIPEECPDKNAPASVKMRMKRLFNMKKNRILKNKMKNLLRV